MVTTTVVMRLKTREVNCGTANGKDAWWQLHVRKDLGEKEPAILFKSVSDLACLRADNIKSRDGRQVYVDGSADRADEKAFKVVLWPGDCVTDVKVVKAPDGDWEKVSPGKDWIVVRNGDDAPQNMNEGATSGSPVYVFYQTKDGQTKDGREPVTGIRLISGASVPKGWTKDPQALNDGASGSAIHLCTLRQAKGVRLAALKAGVGSKVASAMSDFRGTDVVLRQDTSAGASGRYVFLGFTPGETP